MGIVFFAIVLYFSACYSFNFYLFPYIFSLFSLSRSNSLLMWRLIAARSLCRRILNECLALKVQKFVGAELGQERNRYIYIYVYWLKFLTLCYRMKVMFSYLKTSLLV